MLVETEIEKVVKLPPYPVVATPISAVEMQITMASYTLTWNAGAGKFDVVSDGGEVKIVPKRTVKPRPQSSPSDEYTWREVASYRGANGYWMATVEFLKNGQVYETNDYIVVGGDYWSSLDGQLYRTGDFSDWTLGTLPPAVLTPPSGGETGPGNQEQN